MKLRNILYALVLVLASCSAEQGMKDVHVIPEPLEMKVGKSYVSLSEVQLIYRNDDSLPNEAYKISVRRNKIVILIKNRRLTLAKQERGIDTILFQAIAKP
jgi:hypothetical protein